MTKSEDRALLAEWHKILARHARPLERGRRAKGSRLPVVATSSRLDPSGPPPGRAPKQKLCSLVTLGGSASAKPIVKYTGVEMLGLGQLHKSNTVPVFRKQDAVDLANMRRG